MVTIYFSGTGNSRYIAERFSEKTKAACFSIEEVIDFGEVLTTTNTVAVCYPIYGSCVPRILRDFIIAHQSCFEGKKLIIFCTQLMFSGDGARIFTDLLDGVAVEILYAEHFNMPNNICNLPIFPVQDNKKINRYLSKAEAKLERVGRDLSSGIVKKRGFNVLSQYSGYLLQRRSFVRLEKKAEKDVKISAACTVCGKCIKICPMQNLKQVDSGILQNGQCTLCYRCVNQCPQQAITVLLHAPVKKQYPGIHQLYSDDF
ncbi:EFR1 family ferrodoxin [Acetobacterium wieringae]|uniref:Ferredoxin n=1 Tax=Acetobacterium wieringae TaxID=52694 RepID=A0A1F2PHJ8_9FIRM|nr:EFR1 family ferrodoxin [Acetobacterium wieringae]MEA4806681.1 EFR1 family ferrodoxin [Acetobacterium wieringae]OFV70797.1 ferredoxin [Acetobacterium wieringae]URN84308.1 EFR1 family ferrodoxin [Acetobacterium wieringae]